MSLVHTMFDQRIARKRANDMDTGHTCFKCRRKDGESFPIIARKLDAARLNERARGHRTQPRNDAIAGDPFLAIASLQRQPAGLYFRWAGFSKDADAPCIRSLHQ